MLPLRPAVFTRVLLSLAPLRKEVLLLIHLDRKGAYLGDEVIAGGTAWSFGMPYRWMFEQAFRRGASGLVLAHNHPSGTARPSAHDIRSTRGLQALAVPMEIELIDHLIVGRDALFSMRAAGLLDDRPCRSQRADALT
ncbi:MAG: JAB domain-containing protein [Porphyrobacter sp.]|nr:JAB domain-containing protein [Porphyrobacter sp.]